MVQAIIILLLLFTAPCAASETLLVSEAHRDVLLTGYTRAVQHQNLSSELAGKVLHIRYDTGDVVRENPLIEMDTTFVDFQIDKVTQSIHQTDIRIEKARSRVVYLTKESGRVKELSREEMATESRQDAVAHDLEQARLDLQSAEKDMLLLRTELGELLERRNRHFINAPVGWIITRRHIEEQENVQPGTVLARAADYSRLVVPLFVSSEELSALAALGESFNVLLDGLPFNASINWINPEFNEDTRKTAVELIIAGKASLNRGGMKVTMELSVRTEGLFVPKRAVSLRYENPVVTLRTSGETIPIVILADSGDFLHVASAQGLYAGLELAPADDEPQGQEK
jgi:biotin carboxyl carrier protein